MVNLFDWSTWYNPFAVHIVKLNGDFYVRKRTLTSGWKYYEQPRKHGSWDGRWWDENLAPKFCKIEEGAKVILPLDSVQPEGVITMSKLNDFINREEK